MDRAMKQSTNQFHKIFFLISKHLACNAEKTLPLKITNLNIDNFINIYTNTIPILYVTRMTQKEKMIK